MIPIEIINESNNESQKIKRNSYLGTEKKSTATTNGPSRLEVISFKALPRKYEKEIRELLLHLTDYLLISLMTPE